MKIVHNLGNSQVAIEDQPAPKPGPGEILIRTAVSALCGSEMSNHRKEGHASGNSGHEAAGTVEALGEGVGNFRVGQRVGASALAGCGQCDYCRKGQNTWCDSLRFFGNMHAESFVASAQGCHLLPDEVPWEVGVLISGDGMGVPYHTSQKMKDDTEVVAVFGLGPVGLGNTLLQTYLGRQVIGIDRSPDRLDLARRLGAIHTIPVEAGTDVPAAVRALTAGRGADVCIEAAGVPATARQCFAAVRKAGMVIFNGEQPAVELSPSEDFIRRDITAVGSWFYQVGEFPEMLALYQRGLPVASLVTHTFPVDQAADAYQAMEGKSGKVLLQYSSA